MRVLMFGPAALALTLLSVLPLSAQTISARAQVTNYGAITSCPAMVTFHGTITAGNWPAGSSRQVQYRWIRSDGSQGEVQTTTFPAATVPFGINYSWQTNVQGVVSWVALQIVYPSIASPTSPHAVFQVSCPTQGAIVLPLLHLNLPPVQPTPLR